MKRYFPILIMFALLLLSTPSYADISDNQGRYFVTDFGAVGDGETVNTQEIQSAIDACAKSGGKVVIPPGTFVSGTLFMKDNVTLYLTEGSVLLGSPHLKDYPEMSPKARSYTDKYVSRSLLYGENLKNIGISGPGTIDGNGHSPAFQEKGYTNRTRPYLIRFIRCSDIRINDVLLTRSAMWMQHYFECDHLYMHGVRVYNHGNRNNDAVDLDGCSHVVLSDCFFDTDDDGITFKSTSPKIAENITVTNCVVSSHCNAIKMGTESTGGFRNIAVSNCVITPSENEGIVFGRKDGLSGIALELVDGGVYESVTISNISIKRVNTPLFVRLGNRARPYKENIPKPPMGTMNSIIISNVTAESSTLIASSITGLPGHPVRDITLDNILLVSPGGGKSEDTIREIPEVPENYPESSMFGDTLPAYGLYVRHAENILLDNVRLTTRTNDERPAVVIDDADGVDIRNLRADSPRGSQAVVRLIDNRDVLMSGSRAMKDTGTYLEVVGGQSENITLTGSDLSRAKTAVRKADGVPDAVITVK